MLCDGAQGAEGQQRPWGGCIGAQAERSPSGSRPGTCLCLPSNFQDRPLFPCHRGASLKSKRRIKLQADISGETLDYVHIILPPGIDFQLLLFLHVAFGRGSPLTGASPLLSCCPPRASHRVEIYLLLCWREGYSAPHCALWQERLIATQCSSPTSAGVPTSGPPAWRSGSCQRNR